MSGTAIGHGDLPGGEIVAKGLGDLRDGIESIESLLVSIGRPRLIDIGFDVPEPAVADPEMRLYEILAADHGDAAHSRYNALIRRLVSFERAVECARR